MLQFDELESIIKGEALQVFFNAPITELLTDSRNAALHSGTLFFAIQGERHDGHTYIQHLYRNGIRQFVVEREIDISELQEANILQVDSSILALQRLARHHRDKFDLEVIGITGSNGKTIVKEWLHQLVSPFTHAIKTPQSYNSQIGVPLSVWKIASGHRLGIFEAGISKVGEMQALEHIIRPHIGIFTNIGPAHDEGFSSIAEKVKEKALLFRQSRGILYCRDHELIHEHVSTLGIATFSWGKSNEADICLKEIRYQDRKCSVVLCYEREDIGFELPFGDRASIENALHCITYMLFMGYDRVTIDHSLVQLKRIKMRLELKDGINQSYVIDDSYSNDLQGLSVALDFMNQYQLKEKKTLLLSDIPESGISEEELYRNVADILRSKGVTRLIGIGPAICRNRSEFEASADFYLNVDQYLADFDRQDYGNEIILVKGARRFGFERLAHRLEQKIHGTVLEIDLNALVNNLNYYRSKLRPGTKIMVMVKAFAYGNGSQEVAGLLQYHKVDYLAVAYADEGVKLRQQGITLPIMVMNPTVESFDALLKYHLEPELYSLRILRAYLTFLTGRKAKAHLKLDTGMHRLGFVEKDSERLLSKLVAHPNLEIISIFSHLAGADADEHDVFSTQQATRFLQYYRNLQKALHYQPLRHLVNSAGILRFKTYHFDMVRLGIGLYGIESNQKEQARLEHISTLKTVVSQVKIVAAGLSIGYGRAERTKKEMKIATIAIGYADGFPRALGNGCGTVLINGRERPIVGNVCMDMCMVDVTGLTVEAGDEVIVFGRDLPITTMAKKLHTIPYEILTNISQRVKRVFYKE